MRLQGLFYEHQWTFKRNQYGEAERIRLPYKSADKIGR